MPAPVQLELREKIIIIKELFIRCHHCIDRFSEEQKDMHIHIK